MLTSVHRCWVLALVVGFVIMALVAGPALSATDRMAPTTLVTAAGLAGVTVLLSLPPCVLAVAWPFFVNGSRDAPYAAAIGWTVILAGTLTLGGLLLTLLGVERMGGPRIGALTTSVLALLWCVLFPCFPRATRRSIRASVPAWIGAGMLVISITTALVVAA